MGLTVTAVAPLHCREVSRIAQEARSSGAKEHLTAARVVAGAGRHFTKAWETRPAPSDLAGPGLAAVEEPRKWLWASRTKGRRRGDPGRGLHPLPGCRDSIIWDGVRAGDNHFSLENRGTQEGLPLPSGEYRGVTCLVLPNSMINC